MSRMTEEELAEAKEQVARYKKYGEVFHKGDLYRLRSPFETEEMALEFISEDQNTVILLYANRLCTPNGPLLRVRLAGLDPNADYIEEDTGEKGARPGSVFGGDELMNRGLTFMNARDFTTVMRVFRKK